MSSLLIVASRVQAAVKAYCSAKEHADWAQWKGQFVKEKSNSIVAFRQAKAEHPNKKAPDLHPLLAALAIVLDNNEDFSLITENHPELPRHKFYNPSAFFPDLSLFPPKEDCWWEDLAVQSLLGDVPQEPTRGEEPTATQESNEPVARKGRGAAPRVRKLKIHPPKPVQQPVEGEDVAMAVDDPEPAKTSRRKRKAPEAAASSKSSKRPTPASQEADESLPVEDATAWVPPIFVKFECDRCVSKGVECDPEPTGACKRCRDNKVGCSLMPRHESGKANRQLLTRKYVYEYRLQQLLERTKTGDGKGKNLAHDHEDPAQPEASGLGPLSLGPSPSTSLMPLGRMSLASGSSKGDSPAVQPTSLPSSRAAPPSALFSVEVSPPPHARRSRITSTKSQHKSRQHSPDAQSRSSHRSQDPSLEAAVATLQKVVERLQKKSEEDDRWRELVNEKLGL